jgi:hypothetical protein
MVAHPAMVEADNGPLIHCSSVAPRNGCLSCALAGVRLTARRTATFMLQVIVDQASRDDAASWMSKLDLWHIARCEMRHRLAITSAHCIPYHPIRADGVVRHSTMATAGNSHGRPITPSNSNRGP